MLHEQISRGQNPGSYIVEKLSDDDTDLDFPSIEQSLLMQDYEHMNIDSSDATSYIGLIDTQRGVTVVYDIEEDEAVIDICDLSPTKETSLPESLTYGHRTRGIGLSELHDMEQNPSESYIYGTPEFEEAWKNA